MSDRFRKTIAAKFPDIKVLETQLEGFEPSAAEAKAVGILQANPDVTGAFSTTGNGVQTWSGAARKADREVVIIGMDYIRQNLDIIKSGAAYGLVAQPLYEEGAKTAELAAALAEGKEIPYLNPLPAAVDHRRRPRPLLQDPRQRRPVATPREPRAGLLRDRRNARTPMTEPLLQVRDIAKSFGGVPALRGIDVAVRAGEIHALLGQNGAGKSTLVKILNGVHPAGSFTGEIVLAGQPVSFASPADAAAAGIVYVPQEIEVLEQLTVAENVFAGRTGLGDGFLVNRRASWRRAPARSSPTSACRWTPRAIVASLTSAQRHLVMIARALSNRPRVLMLDEPTASLSGTEVDGALRRAAPAAARRASP